MQRSKITQVEQAEGPVYKAWSQLKSYVRAYRFGMTGCDS